MKKIKWRIIPIILFVFLSIFLWRGLSLNPRDLPSVQIGKHIPDFKLQQLQNPQNTLSSSDFNNQVILLNVWASWCAACVEEQVFMLQLARQGISIYGLNYKDRAEDALQWLAQWGNPYQIVAQDPKGKVAIDLGVYGAPETFVIDKKGIIRYRHAGVVNQGVWQKEIWPLIKKLEQIK